jgi:hypothetical protein
MNASMGGGEKGCRSPKERQNNFPMISGKALLSFFLALSSEDNQIFSLSHITHEKILPV